MINGRTPQQVNDAIVSHDETIRAYMLKDPAATMESARPNTRSLRALATDLGFRDSERPSYSGRYAVEKCASWLRRDGFPMLRDLFTEQEWVSLSELYPLPTPGAR